jgi:hypothetical protein
MEFYAAIKKNKIMSFGGKYIELKFILLHKVCKTHTDKDLIISLIYRIQVLNDMKVERVLCGKRKEPAGGTGETVIWEVSMVREDCIHV